MLLYAIFFALYEKAMCNIHPLCSPRSTPTWPFDVKPPTYEPIGLIPTRELQGNSCRPWAPAHLGMFADFSQISILVSRTCLFSSLTSNLSFYDHRFILNRLDMSNPQCYNLTNLKENNRWAGRVTWQYSLQKTDRWWEFGMYVPGEWACEVHSDPYGVGTAGTFTVKGKHVSIELSVRWAGL